jgi:hypothetical protein
VKNTGGEKPMVQKQRAKQNPKKQERQINSAITDVPPVAYTTDELVLWLCDVPT